MLAKLTIKNVALIESAEICFSEGLNVLSGETGAGKSVILDSVNFVLGAKADRNMIRYGEEECFVRAEFTVPEYSSAVKTLEEMDIETDGEIIISRKFSESGKNSIKINGNTVTAAMLRKVTDSLVDVHGQSEHFFLLKESNQLKTLDEVVGSELTDKKQELGVLIAERKSGERIFTLGTLIHNGVFNAELAKKGVEITSVDELTALAKSACKSSPVTVFFVSVKV